MDLEQETGQNLQNGQVPNSDLCFIIMLACIFELTCIPKSILDSIPLLFHYYPTLQQKHTGIDKQEEQSHFTMQFSLEKMK